MYHERPLPHHTLGKIASSCVFLCEVHTAQQSLLTADLRQLTAVHAAAYSLRDDITRARVSTKLNYDCCQILFINITSFVFYNLDDCITG